MATQNARVHGTHVSNRAKAKEVLEKKAVLKSVLDNPLKVKWPSIPLNLQNLILSRLVDVLEKRPPLRNCGKPERPAERNGSSASTLPQPDYQVAVQDSHPVLERPASVNGRQRSIVVGINAVTRALECQLDTLQQAIVLSTNTIELSNQTPAHTTIAAVFVCQQDV
ncbi:hypothetical protein CONPUDRAFT_79198, partial [Coniophora puteana RWD-64-598 SS2]